MAWVTLARPEKRNALSPEVIMGLHSAFDRAARDESVHAIVLSAEGRDFCAGADLESLAALLDAPADVHFADARALADLFLAMRALPKPILAAVQGRALAGGAGLVTACDIVLAADNSSFGYPEVKIGFVAAVVMALLSASVGEKAAFELLTTGRTIPADEAARIGLVTRVVPSAALETSVREFILEVAALPPAAVARTKELFYGVARGISLEEAFERAIEANVAARTTVEFRDGLTAFLAHKRESRS